MANYQTHARFNLLLALPLLAFFLHYFFEPGRQPVILFSGAFAYATLFMNPDLDLANQIKIFSLRGLLTLPFRFYSLVFRHRGLSHHFFLGTLTRLLWLSCFYILIAYLWDQRNGYETLASFYSRYKSHLIFVFSGIFCADAGHLFLDYAPLRKRR